jgi:organic radical activating enzyme
MPQLPADLQEAVRINWHLTSWCNYSCQYCPVVVFHQRSKTGQAQPHAFDHRPVADWVGTIGRFPFKLIHLNISGGEPFLDRANFRALLAGLLEMSHIRVSVCTNGYWDPSWYRGFDAGRVSLTVAYHPNEVSLETFVSNVRRMRDAGFKISMVNFVLAPENIEDFENAFCRLEAEGFFVNVSAMISAGLYWARTERTEREIELIERYNTPSDNYFKFVKPETKGHLCFYPAMTYYLMYDGAIQIACQDQTVRNVFEGEIPHIPREAVPCEYDRCVGCSDMYRSLVDHAMVQTPLGFFGSDEYVNEVRSFRLNRSADGRPYPSLRAMLDQANAQQRPSLVSIGGQSHPVPECDVFGANDLSRICARSRDRISVSGWAASGKLGAPVKEVRLVIKGQVLGVFRDFFDRPEVAAEFGRAELLRCGWRGMIYLPALPQGEYELIPEACDAEGNWASLPPSTVSIAD